MDRIQLKAETAVTAINRMLRGGHFDICVITSVAELYDINTTFMRRTEAFKILHSLHCIDYKAMTPNIRDAIPGLIKECLSAEAPEVFQFPMPETRQSRSTAVAVIDVSFTEAKENAYKRYTEEAKETPVKKAGLRLRLPWSRE